MEILKLKQYISGNETFIRCNQKQTKGLPWWLRGHKSTCQKQETRVQEDLWSGRIPHTAEQLRSGTATLEPVLQSPGAAATKACVLWHSCSEKGEATTMRSPCTATWEKPVKQQVHSTVKNKYIYSFIKANQKRQQKTPVSNKTDLQKLSNLKKKKKTKLNLRSMIFIDYYIQQPQKMHSLTAHMKSRQTTCQFKIIIFKNFKKQKSYRVQFFQHNWK